jgi:hypothetical protein
MRHMLDFESGYILPLACIYEGPTPTYRQGVGHKGVGPGALYASGPRLQSLANSAALDLRYEEKQERDLGLG